MDKNLGRGGQETVTFRSRVGQAREALGHTKIGTAAATVIADFTAGARMEASRVNGMMHHAARKKA